MFSHIRTSKENKEIVTKLTSKFNLGSENHIARIALAYSLEHDNHLDLKDLKDSGGKEYSRIVLFGDLQDYIIGIICLKYKIHSNHGNLPKYVKIHLDKGLQFIHLENLSFSNFINPQNSSILI
jgi:DNA sulfur modification protein DndE